VSCVGNHVILNILNCSLLELDSVRYQNQAEQKWNFGDDRFKVLISCWEFDTGVKSFQKMSFVIY